MNRRRGYREWGMNKTCSDLYNVASQPVPQRENPRAESSKMVASRKRRDACRAVGQTSVQQGNSARGGSHLRGLPRKSQTAQGAVSWTDPSCVLWRSSDCGGKHKPVGAHDARAERP